MIPHYIFYEPQYTMKMAGSLYDYLRSFGHIQVETISSNEVPEPYLSLWKEDIFFKTENPCFKITIEETVLYMDAWEMSQESWNSPRTVFRFYIETRVNMARNYANENFGSYSTWNDEAIDWNDKNIQEVKPLYDYLGKETWSWFFNALATY